MKRITLAQRLTAFMTSMAVTLASLCVNVSAVSTRFVGRFYSDTNIDLSGIKLDIYTSDLSYSDEMYEKYRNNYSFSTYTDENGNFSFNRPSGMFIVKADMSTLPKKTGITQGMWTVADNTDSIYESVNKIKYINIDSSNVESGEVKVDIQSADGTYIFCNYTVSISDTEITEAAKDESGKRTYRTERTITVKANGLKKTQLLVGEFTETAVPVVSLTKPTYDAPASYTESGGFFTVHYDKNEYSAETAKNVYATFSDSKAFYDKYGFNQPIKESGSQKYNIYLITDGGAAATTKHVKKGSSYIIMRTPLDYSKEKYLYQTSAIAHELFHAIMYTYTRAYDVNPPKWFRESFANWAGNAYINTSTSTLQKYVNIFQSNPELSITNTFDSRVYGSMLFPQTISENFGGITTIRTILEQFKNVSKSSKNPEMDAISKGLNKVNKAYSRTSAFVRFALNNMYPATFYSLKNSNKWENAARSTDGVYDSCDFRNLDCQPMSARYYDVIPGFMSDSVYITITDNTKKYSNISMCCAVKNSSGKLIGFTDSTKGFVTYKIKKFTGFDTSVVSFGIVNTSLSKTQKINIKVTYA